MFELVPARLPPILWLVLAATMVVGTGGAVAMIADGDPALWGSGRRAGNPGQHPAETRGFGGNAGTTQAGLLPH